MTNIWFIIHRYLDRLSMPGNGSNRFQRYGLAVLLTSVFFLIKTTLITIFGKDVPFLFALFIVILSAWFGGLGPGLFATGLAGTVTYFFFLEPKLTFFGQENIPNMVFLITFFMEGFFISILSESHRRSDIQRSEFIGVISHELKNPLTTIKGYADMIYKATLKTKDSKLNEYSLRIDQQIKQVLEMINEVLDITKIETGRLTYHSERFDFNELAKNIVSDLQVTTDIHQLNLKIVGKNIVNGDRYRIGQVITNLLNNAIKYSPNSRKINVKVENKKDFVLLTVEDFGPGISERDQAKLFLPFFRAKNSQSIQGTGIGLFISSEIVDHHNGKLWVQSTLKKGSTFYLQLPLDYSV